MRFCGSLEGRQPTEAVGLSPEFPNRKKWFDDAAAISLSRIQRAIRAESNTYL